MSKKLAPPPPPEGPAEFPTVIDLKPIHDKEPVQLLDTSEERKQAAAAISRMLEILEPLTEAGRIRATRAVVSFYSMREDLD
jgi:hypothetical protein